MDKLFKSIDVLCDYVRNINNNTKGKKERYYIADQIIDFRKEVVLLFHRFLVLNLAKTQKTREESFLVFH